MATTYTDAQEFFRLRGVTLTMLEHTTDVRLDFGGGQAFYVSYNTLKSEDSMRGYFLDMCAWISLYINNPVVQC